MGDAADDYFDAEMAEEDRANMLFKAGVRACPRTPSHFKTDRECPVCADLGWIDKDGKPCEP